MIRFPGLGDSDMETILNGMEDYQTGIMYEYGRREAEAVI